MATTQEKTTRKIGKDTQPESDPAEIDRNAPAGSENSLGAESVRDGRRQRTTARSRRSTKWVLASPLRSPPTRP
jgi:hypothetical protein